MQNLVFTSMLNNHASKKKNWFSVNQKPNVNECLTLEILKGPSMIRNKTKIIKIKLFVNNFSLVSYYNLWRLTVLSQHKLINLKTNLIYRIAKTT